MQRCLFICCIPVLLFTASCGDSGSGGGFGAIGGAFGGGSGSEATSFLYVTNRGSNNISGFSINAATGRLAAVPGSPFETGSGPSAIAVLPNRFVAYVANGQANTVTAFAISTEGGLSQLSSTGANPNPVSVDITPSALAISANAQFLYVANRGADRVTTFSIGTGGVLTRVAQTGGTTNPVLVIGLAPDSLALSHDGKWLYAANHGVNEITAFSVDSSGLLTKISPAGANTNPLTTGGSVLQGIASSPTAPFLYAIHNNSSPVVTFRIESNGLLTRVPSSGGRANPLPDGIARPNAVILSRDSRFLYSANGDGTITVFGVGGDGLLSLASNGNPGSTVTSPAAMTLSPDGQHLYLANSVGRISAYTIATDTGLLTPLSSLVGNPFLAGERPSGIAAFSSP